MNTLEANTVAASNAVRPVPQRDALRGSERPRVLVGEHRHARRVVPVSPPPAEPPPLEGWTQEEIDEEFRVLVAGLGETAPVAAVPCGGPLVLTSVAGPPARLRWVDLDDATNVLEPDRVRRPTGRERSPPR